METISETEVRKINYHFGKVKIDSLRIQIPYSQVNDFTSMSEPLQTVGKVTGNVYKDDWSEMKVLNEVGGVKARAQKQVWFSDEKDLLGNQKKEEYFVVALTAKMLGERYWEGITIDNIEIAYEWLQKNVGCKYDFQTFMSASIADVDFCIDVPANREVWSDTMKNVWSMIYYSNENYCRKFKKKGFISGIEFSERHKQSPTKPHCKLYYKDNQWEDEPEFNQQTFGGIKHSVGRYEQNFKNKKWWNRIDDLQSPTSLWELLMSSMGMIEQFCKKSLSVFYLQKRIVVRNFNHNQMQPTDFIIHSMLSALINNAGWSRDDFRGIAKVYAREYGDSLDHTQVKRMFEKIDMYFEEFSGIADKPTLEKLERNGEVNRVAKTLGLWD